MRGVVPHSLFCVVGKPARKLLCRTRARKRLMFFHLFLNCFQVNRKPALFRDFCRELNRESVCRIEHKNYLWIHVGRRTSYMLF